MNNGNRDKFEGDEFCSRENFYDIFFLWYFSIKFSLKKAKNHIVIVLLSA